ncbi:(5-formylfuran-3-yl)methyl phosphate synthase [Rosistilla oblonga]|uniref:(5-formylfuran-3-yl)methyl phosphate synthase n=1 Tax=Rosistilla oblonga TaxID=2527990 RepID=A0A518IR73_9BACT|nr:(5-formylfuran-3-yl)methyl phosphate synthase [Rosistilla oblonga]QDV55589.1 hypothetical protein Mal33_15660 [Rosistilla oblonga]
MLQNTNKSAGLPIASPAVGGIARTDAVPLLISVRSIAEAKIACQFPLAIIDFKNPKAGALGRCSDAVLQRVASLKPTGLGFSAACGELRELQSHRLALPAGIRFAKAGPAGLCSASQIRDAMLRFRAALPDATTSVAVAYADHAEADCAPVETIAELAIQTEHRWVLIDTATKDGRRLLDWLTPQQLTDVISMGRQHGIGTVLAGSLALQDIDSLRSLGADLLGIRGAVCSGGRDSQIDPDKIAAWCQAMASAEAPIDR